MDLKYPSSFLPPLLHDNFNDKHAAKEQLHEIPPIILRSHQKKSTERFDTKDCAPSHDRQVITLHGLHSSIPRRKDKSLKIYLAEEKIGCGKYQSSPFSLLAAMLKGWFRLARSSLSSIQSPHRTLSYRAGLSSLMQDGKTSTMAS